MPSFNIAWSAIPDVISGNRASIVAQISAADLASVGNYNVNIVMKRVSDAHVMSEGNQFGKTITQTPTQYSRTWNTLGIAPGQYEAQINLWSSTVNVWVAQMQTFNVMPVAVTQPTILNKVSGDQLGCTVSQAMVAPLVVQALDANSNPVSGVTVNWSASAGSLAASTSTTGADGKAQVNWTAPATPQPNTITATVGSLTAQFSEQSHMVLYGVHSPFPAELKAVDSSKDPLVNGFIPNTGETWTPVANMSDEFTGSAIDTTKWYLRLPGGYDHYNDELQRYVDTAVTVSNGTCKLTAVPRPATVGHAASPSGFQYTLYDSGVITSKSAVTGDYYAECRLRLPSGQGVWPAYWGLPTTNYKGETDFMEYVYNNGTERQNMIHNNNLCDGAGNQIFWCDSRYNGQYGFWSAPSTLSPTYMVDDWRVLACHKRADRTTIYLDGQPLSQRKISPYNLPLQIIHNLAMGGSWPTTNSSGAAWTQPVSLGPEVFELDYTRVYTPS
jgi:hypothetical protein